MSVLNMLVMLREFVSQAVPCSCFHVFLKPVNVVALNLSTLLTMHDPL